MGLGLAPAPQCLFCVTCHPSHSGFSEEPPQLGRTCPSHPAPFVLPTYPPHMMLPPPRAQQPPPSRVGGESMGLAAGWGETK